MNYRAVKLPKQLTKIVLILSLILNAVLLFRQPIDSGIAVLGVIDGDTLVLDGKVRLRLRQIDAPELKYCGGEKAKKQLEDLVLNQRIRVEEKILDTQGRPMALIYVGNTLINQIMLESGWARYHSDSTSKVESLKAAANTAKEAGKGIFSECVQTENPDQPGCNIKANIDKNSDKRLYYLPNCAQYKTTLVEKDLGEDWFCTEKSAQAAGFTKAATCK